MWEFKNYKFGVGKTENYLKLKINFNFFIKLIRNIYFCEGLRALICLLLPRAWEGQNLTKTKHNSNRYITNDIDKSHVKDSRVSMFQNCLSHLKNIQLAKLFLKKYEIL